MIIVEGPDNSGKSTLVSTLIKEFKLTKLKPYKNGPPSNEEDNYYNSLSIVNEAIRHPNKNCICDRLSLIGESIYGPICRGKDLWVNSFGHKMKLLNSLRYMDPFIIYCRPPTSIVLDMTSHKLKEYDTEEHINQIKSNKRLILEAYDNYFAFWRDHNFYTYNYMNNQSYNNLLTRLKEYLK